MIDLAEHNMDHEIFPVLLLSLIAGRIMHGGAEDGGGGGGWGVGGGGRKQAETGRTPAVRDSTSYGDRFRLESLPMTSNACAI